MPQLFKENHDKYEVVMPENKLYDNVSEIQFTIPKQNEILQSLAIQKKLTLNVEC